MSNIVTCPNCGQKNRIGHNSDDSRPICAKCWTALNVPKKSVQPPPPPKEPYIPPPPKKTGGNENISSGTNWVWLLVIGGFIWWVVSQDTNTNLTTKSTSAQPILKATPTYPEVAMPYSGAIQVYTNSQRIAPFEIKTSQGANYLVKLVSAYSQEPVMTIFVRGGYTVTAEVPLGIYEVKYASGVKWYGYEYLFGPETSYNKANETFVFQDTGYQVTGYTITLYRVSNGNLRTSSINQSQF